MAQADRGTHHRATRGGDQVTVTGLEVWCHVGVPDEERERPQRLLVTAAWETDCAAAARGDDVAGAVDYARVAEAIKQEASARPRKLVETLAEDIARMVLKEFAVRGVTIEVEKSALKDARSVSVKITRTHHA